MCQAINITLYFDCNLGCRRRVDYSPCSRMYIMYTPSLRSPDSPFLKSEYLGLLLCENWGHFHLVICKVHTLVGVRSLTVEVLGAAGFQ